MPVSYVCLSDLHLGEEDSLLTNLRPGTREIEPTAASPTLVRLGECLRELLGDGPPATLVLQGDILELATARDGECLMAFERFIEEVVGLDTPLFDRVVYAPGNHDHHVWEGARDDRYQAAVAAAGWGERLPEYRHTTPAFEPLGAEACPHLLDEVIARSALGNRLRVEIAYPVFGVESPAGAVALFSHGHFIEPLYLAVSLAYGWLFRAAVPPARLEVMERQNNAWIEFLWSILGRSGAVGEKVEDIYDALDDESAVSGVLGDVSAGVARVLGWRGPTGLLSKGLLRWSLRRTVARYVSERAVVGEVLTGHTEAGLYRFVTDALRAQLAAERPGAAEEQVAILFGHTHKPFLRKMGFTGFARPVSVLNTGGWVVDGPAPSPVHGAAVGLLGHDLEPVLLQLYQERDDPADYRVAVEGAPGGALFDEVADRVRPESAPWREFSRAAARAVRYRL